MAMNPLSWLAPAALDRLTLVLNHVISSEPVAQGKLRPFSGQMVDIRWQRELSTQLPSYLGAALDSVFRLPPNIRFQITPAGLLERHPTGDNPDTPAGEPATPHLTIHIQLADPLNMAARLIKGQRPEVKIDGDAALAEAASWMMKSLRWDIEDDLARWMGNTPAQMLSTLSSGVKQAFERWRPNKDASTAPH